LDDRAERELDSLSADDWRDALHIAIIIDTVRLRCACADARLGPLHGNHSHRAPWALKVLMPGPRQVRIWNRRGNEGGKGGCAVRRQRRGIEVIVARQLHGQEGRERRHEFIVSERVDDAELRPREERASCRHVASEVRAVRRELRLIRRGDGPRRPRFDHDNERRRDVARCERRKKCRNRLPRRRLSKPIRGTEPLIANDRPVGSGVPRRLVAAEPSAETALVDGSTPRTAMCVDEGRRDAATSVCTIVYKKNQGALRDETGAHAGYTPTFMFP
jgi:hypothetical protein